MAEQKYVAYVSTYTMKNKNGITVYDVDVEKGIMTEKGAVEIDKRTGVYKYTPKTSKDECVKSEVASFIERVFDNNAYNLMASLVRDGKLTEQEKKDIIEILNGIED